METLGTMTGMKGVISMGTGAEMEVHPWETVEMRPEGVYLHHHDSYETITFMPMYTLRQMRLHDAAKERSGSNNPVGERSYRHAHPALDRDGWYKQLPAVASDESNEKHDENQQKQ